MIIIVGVLGVAPSVAQSSLNADLLAVDSAFVNGEYERVELLALRILRDNSALNADEIARLNLTAGYALIMLNRENDARRSFHRALDAVPDLALDPVQVSPKFRVIFDEVKAARPVKQAIPPQALRVDSLPKPVTAHFSQAMLLNLAVPGSGQWSTGHSVRGAVFFAAEAAAVAMLIASASDLRDSRADYLAETDPQRARQAYDRYNSDYQTTWLWGICSAAVYIAAQADLARIGWHSEKIAIAPMTYPVGLSLAVRW